MNIEYSHRNFWLAGNDVILLYVYNFNKGFGVMGQICSEYSKTIFVIYSHFYRWWRYLKIKVRPKNVR